ncbi:hypothetical protein K8T06_01060 [bacterium]|nr:hypothetical protein [bacterium]
MRETDSMMYIVKPRLKTLGHNLLADNILIVLVILFIWIIIPFKSSETSNVIYLMTGLIILINLARLVDFMSELRKQCVFSENGITVHSVFRKIQKLKIQEILT